MRRRSHEGVAAGATPLAGHGPTGIGWLATFGGKKHDDASGEQPAGMGTQLLVIVPRAGFPSQ